MNFSLIERLFRVWFALFCRWLHSLYFMLFEIDYSHMYVTQYIVTRCCGLPIWVTYTYIGCTCGKVWYYTENQAVTIEMNKVL